MFKCRHTIPILSKNINISKYKDMIGKDFTEKEGTMEYICHIEITKNGSNYVARAFLANGRNAEYKNPILEDMLTEMVLDLHAELSEQ
ncbi:MAG: hypothetical protein DRN01_00945 [Thermoplasmata archaeon]|nr:MAG: hypothetical protein DRN01_00945 [Thermoplasmata archaeon]